MSDVTADACVYRVRLFTEMKVGVEKRRTAEEEGVPKEPEMPQIDAFMHVV